MNMETKSTHITPVGGNVFADLGFAPEEAAELKANSQRVIADKASKKILFLDFDGVLHAVSGPAASMREFVWLPILKEILFGQGHDQVRVVIHASYRRATPADFLRQRLGFDETQCLGVTNPRMDRWPSIQDWLQQNPWVESYRILDDQEMEFPSPPPPELILCDSRRGLTDLRVQDLLKEWIHG